MENRLFFPQAALDQWILDGVADLEDGELRMAGKAGAGRRYSLADAVRVLREVSGSEDANDLVGRVRTRASLEALGAEIVETSMILRDNAYDVEAGWLGLPLGVARSGRT
jgi:hypothetical protein